MVRQFSSRKLAKSKSGKITTGQVLQTLFGHTTIVTHAAYSPDGKRIAWGAGDGTVRMGYPVNRFSRDHRPERLLFVAVGPISTWAPTRSPEAPKSYPYNLGEPKRASLGRGTSILARGGSTLRREEAQRKPIKAKRLSISLRFDCAHLKVCPSCVALSPRPLIHESHAYLRSGRLVVGTRSSHLLFNPRKDQAFCIWFQDCRNHSISSAIPEARLGCWISGGNTPHAYVSTSKWSVSSNSAALRIHSRIAFWEARR